MASNRNEIDPVDRPAPTSHLGKPVETPWELQLVPRITLYPLDITRTLAVTALVLVLAHITGQVTKYVWEHDTAYGLIRLFDVDNENNIPSYFSASLLLVAALLLTFITALKKTTHAAYAFQWALLSLGFLYLSIDEAASLHELLNKPMKELLGGNAGGFFTFAWVIPAAIAVIAVGIAYVKFFLHLPMTTRWGFGIAAALFLGGAIGIELVGGHYIELYGRRDPAYIISVTVEESLEMAGVIVFVHTLLKYIAREYNETRIRVESARTRHLSLTSAFRPRIVRR